MKRSMQHIIRQYKKACDIFSAYHKSALPKWFDPISKLADKHEDGRGRVWGKFKKTKIVISCSPRSYTTDYVDSSSKELFVQTLTDEELPLHITDDSIRDLIGQRIRGELPVIPQRQDLVKKFFAFEDRLLRLGDIRAGRKETIYQKIRQEYGREFGDSYSAYHKDLLVLDVDGEFFYFDLKNHIGMINSDNVLHKKV